MVRTKPRTLSPLLFNLVPKVLACPLRQEREIQDTQVGNQEENRLYSGDTLSLDQRRPPALLAGPPIPTFCTNRKSTGWRPSEISRDHPGGGVGVRESPGPRSKLQVWPPVHPTVSVPWPRDPGEKAGTTPPAARGSTHGGPAEGPGPGSSP